MILALPEPQIEELLAGQYVGRLGCYADGRTYVVPIAYAYSGGYVYGHSAPGAKIRMMRHNPHVCFEVDSVETPSSWKSVIAQGVFEELHGEDAREAMRVLLLRFLHEKAQPFAHSIAPTRPGLHEEEAIVYRIRLIEKTGRFEEPVAV